MNPVQGASEDSGKGAPSITVSHRWFLSKEGVVGLHRLRMAGRGWGGGREGVVAIDEAELWCEVKVQKIVFGKHSLVKATQGRFKNFCHPAPPHLPNEKPTSKGLVHFERVQFQEVDQADLTPGSEGNLAAVVPIQFCTFFFLNQFVTFLIGK